MKLNINNKAVQSEIKKNVAEMRAKPYICEERFAIAELPGMQVHVVVTREEEDFLDEVDPAFTAHAPEQPPEQLHDQLFFVGYTNGYQVQYGAEEEGSFYNNTDRDSVIPLYMLKIHQCRLESTTGGAVTLDSIKAVRRPAPPETGEAQS
ncbi:hypothetical protein [Microbulbifer sp. SAOS-129_SWC]|uniref:hypothetical protein n=1 Tax=Microbulbifer sp. SAOS-129_SWC TaxID=3145235 RepID=UPI003217C5C5